MVEPRRMFVNEFGCTITSVTVITKRAAPIANAGLDLQVSLTCSGEGRRGRASELFAGGYLTRRHFR